MGDTIKHINICIKGIPEGEERESSRKNNTTKEMKKFPNLLQNNSLDIQEIQLTSNTINEKRSMNRYIMIKMMKVEDKIKILRTAREK